MTDQDIVDSPCSPLWLVRLGSRAEPLQGVPASLMVRVYRQRPSEVGDSLLAPSFGLEEVTSIAVGYRIVRIDPYGLIVVGDRAIVVPLALHSAASVVVGHCEIRVDVEGLIEVGDSAVMVPLTGIRDAPIGEGHGAVACQCAVRLEHGRAAADLHVKRELLNSFPYASTGSGPA